MQQASDVRPSGCFLAEVLQERPLLDSRVGRGGEDWGLALSGSEPAGEAEVFIFCTDISAPDPAPSVKFHQSRAGES